MIQVLLADDHKLVRDGLKSLLRQKSEDIEVVAEATTGTEVLSLLETTTVDVVVMDIDMPQMNGIEATRLVRQRFPQVKVLMLTMAGSEQWVRESLAAGAQGYLLKSGSYQELIHALEMVCQGEEYFSSDLTKRLLEQRNTPVRTLATGVSSDPETTHGPTESQAYPATISPRELEVLRLIARGYTNQQISELLFTSRRTIETHRQNLLEKTGATNTATLIMYAVSHGLLA